MELELDPKDDRAPHWIKTVAREHIEGGDGYEARAELMAMEERYPGISRGGETSLLR